MISGDDPGDAEVKRCPHCGSHSQERITSLKCPHNKSHPPQAKRLLQFAVDKELAHRELQQAAEVTETTPLLASKPTAAAHATTPTMMRTRARGRAEDGHVPRLHADEGLWRRWNSLVSTKLAQNCMRRKLEAAS